MQGEKTLLVGDPTSHFDLALPFRSGKREKLQAISSCRKMSIQSIVPDQQQQHRIILLGNRIRGRGVLVSRLRLVDFGRTCGMWPGVF
jgi:hypothetical protein